MLHMVLCISIFICAHIFFSWRSFWWTLLCFSSSFFFWTLKMPHPASEIESEIVNANSVVAVCHSRVGETLHKNELRLEVLKPKKSKFMKKLCVQYLHCLNFMSNAQPKVFNLIIYFKSEKSEIRKLQLFAHNAKLFSKIKVSKYAEIQKYSEKWKQFSILSPLDLPWLKVWPIKEYYSVCVRSGAGIDTDHYKCMLMIANGIS